MAYKSGKAKVGFVALSYRAVVTFVSARTGLGAQLGRKRAAKVQWQSVSCAV